MNLAELIDGLGLRPRSYSGRGMYGETCLGVTVNNPVNVAFELGRLFDDEFGPDKPSPRVAWDSMGRDYILYFPSVPFEGTDEDEDDDE